MNLADWRVTSALSMDGRRHLSELKRAPFGKKSYNSTGQGTVQVRRKEISERLNIILLKCKPEDQRKKYSTAGFRISLANRGAVRVSQMTIKVIPLSNERKLNIKHRQPFNCDVPNQSNNMVWHSRKILKQIRFPQ
ncbi:hypothetical protein TNCV_1440631 [Trichonephila clavipes]|nr:hypothetical protein TNCV_1440631 [Trichonephila clavipes]